MPIVYLGVCTTTSQNEKFGLCDEPSPATRPAYIDESNEETWIAQVINKEKKEVHFNAIDNCVEVKRPDGGDDKRCDGVLSYDDKLIFVELKERASGKWLKIGREQLTATILRFQQENDITQFSSIKGFVCNSIRPLAHSGQLSNIQKFKDDTGFQLEGKNRIDI